MTHEQWQWIDADNSELALGAVFSKERMIATVWKSSHADIAGAMQNARLIAAAPELLEALLLTPCHKALNFRFGYEEPSDFWVEKINPCSRCAAIAKATGQQP